MRIAESVTLVLPARPVTPIVDAKKSIDANNAVPTPFDFMAGYSAIDR
jgi:hypothetical protein